MKRRRDGLNPYRLWLSDILTHGGCDSDGSFALRQFLETARHNGLAHHILFIMSLRDYCVLLLDSELPNSWQAH